MSAPSVEASSSRVVLPRLVHGSSLARLSGPAGRARFVSAQVEMKRNGLNDSTADPHSLCLAGPWCRSLVVVKRSLRVGSVGERLLRNFLVYVKTWAFLLHRSFVFCFGINLADLRERFLLVRPLSPTVLTRPSSCAGVRHGARDRSLLIRLSLDRMRGWTLDSFSSSKSRRRGDLVQEVREAWREKCWRFRPLVPSLLGYGGPNSRFFASLLSPPLLSYPAPWCSAALTPGRGIHYGGM